MVSGMTRKIDKSWHLAQTEAEILVTEFEFQLWRVFYGFLRWQEDCQSYICNYDLTGYELALLHIIRMKDRPKTIYEISRLLNRDDPNNVQYGISKLLKLGLIEKVKSTSSKKALSYQATPLGVQNTEDYLIARRNILIELFEEVGMDNIGIKKATKALNLTKGIYDEASRIAASYKQHE